MSLPSLFEYMPEQARTLCKAAAFDPRPLINAVPLGAAAVGGLTGGFASRDEGFGGVVEGVARGAAGAGLGALAGQRVGGALGMGVGALTGLNGAGPINRLEDMVLGGAEGGEAVGRLAGSLYGAGKGYRLLRKEKVAGEQERTPGQKAQGAAKVLSTGLLGFATGSLAGAGGAYLMDKWHEAATGNKIPVSALHKVAPFVGGAAGLAYNIYKARELEELRRALANKSDHPQGRVPPK